MMGATFHGGHPERRIPGAVWVQSQGDPGRSFGRLTVAESELAASARADFSATSPVEVAMSHLRWRVLVVAAKEALDPDELWSATWNGAQEEALAIWRAAGEPAVARYLEAIDILDRSTVLASLMPSTTQSHWEYGDSVA
jgi:hypothetical protein